MKIVLVIALGFSLFTVILASYKSTLYPSPSRCVPEDAGSTQTMKTDECIEADNPGAVCGPGLTNLCSHMATCDSTTLSFKSYSEKLCKGTPFSVDSIPLNTCRRFSGTSSEIIHSCVPGKTVSSGSTSQAQISITLFFAGVVAMSMCLWS